MKMNQLNLPHSPLLILIKITFLFTTSLAQSPISSPAPAAPPTPAAPATPAAPIAPIAAPLVPSAPSKGRTGPTNITKILEKAGQFSLMIRLLKSTQLVDQLNSILNKTNQGLTFFAPTDNAFSNLPSGTLNAYSDQQKTQLVQFHIIPTYVPISQFQTLSNPVRTQAGNTDYAQYPLNITTDGVSVNMSTGIVNASVSGTVYTDGKLAVYQVDKVLLPQKFYVTPAPTLPPALAPAPADEPKKKKKTLPTTTIATPTISGDVSSRITRYTGVSYAVAVIAVITAIVS